MWKVSHCEIGGDDLNDLKSQLNIRDLQYIGEPQADHQEAGQNQTKKRQLLQYQGIVGVFSLYKVRDQRHGKVTIISNWEFLNNLQ